MRNIFKFNRNRKAFTLVELLVVIAIIGVLATIVFVSYEKSQSKSRDARRLQDLSTISSAGVLYYTDHKTFGVSGAGWDGGGQGSFNYLNASDHYSQSINQGLINAGYLPGVVVDPTGTTSMHDGDTIHYYMYYWVTSPANKLSVYAVTDSIVQDPLEFQKSADTVNPASMGMNYALTVVP